MTRFKVISLFDGISVAKVALDKARIRVGKYVASEIDPGAIEVANKNNFKIEQIGDVRKVDGNKYKNFDLLIGGSPCQDLSVAKHNREGLAGARSGLFYEYLRILREAKPRYFILENVASMPAEAKAVITAELGVKPILIDAKLVSAQRRKRLFWTNIEGVKQPPGQDIYLKDILQPEEEIDEKYYISEQTLANLKGWSGAQSGRIYGVDGKSITLQAGGGGTGAKTGLYAIEQRARGKNKGNLHFEKSPTLTANSFEQNNRVVQLTEVRTPEAKAIRKKTIEETGQDWSPRRKKELVPRTDGKANVLTTSPTKENLLLAGKRVRKLTPIECERLQSLPDNYSQGPSDGTRYKLLGNAFNAEVVAWILKSIKL